MKKKLPIRVFAFSIFVFLFGLKATAMAAMANYTALPPFLSQTVKPNVLVILDTSTSMLKYAYTGNYSSGTTYDGYFDPSANYSYNSTYDYFYEDAVGSWDGNLLNWISTRRMDIAKLVLTGGRTTTAGDGSTLLLGQPYPSGCGWPEGFETGTKSYDGNSYYNKRVVDATGPYFRLNDSSTGDIYYIRVKVDSTPQGVIQNSGPYYRFGLQIYSPTGSADQGGKVLSPVAEGAAAHIADIVNNINSQDMLSDPVGADTWTPMAENLYTAAGYFAQSSTVSTNGPMYAAGDYQVNNTWDPYYFDAISTTVSCAKAFVILISDGESNHDSNLPAGLKTSYGVTGTDKYLDDVALWAHTNDIRTSSFGIDLTGTQLINLYAISTFGGGEALLKSAAKFGGFVDSNSNNLPDLTREWDKDSDGLPDNYFQASGATELADALNNALYDILKRVAAGSAISVLSTSEMGEGAVYQAFFFPKLIDGKEILWPGYLRALFIDTYGNLREDTDGDAILDMAGDKIIDYFFDDVEHRARVKRYADSDGDGVRDGSPEIMELHEINNLWAAGKVLAATSPSTRNIYTWIDSDTAGTIGTVDTGEFSSSSFVTTNKTTLRPYLGVATATEAENIISYVRGTDDPGLGYTNRSRLINVDGTDRVWKLGDIVYSTPSPVGMPMENFDFIYGDASYATFKNTYKDRRNVVYVGANDGMLHAFNAGFYNKTQSQFTAGTGKTLGQELWAYIPYNLLPHLQWLADPNYSHVYYVDLKPRVIDAKIFSDDATHPGGWGTVLVCGMRFGGGAMTVTDDFGSGTPSSRTFRSAYFALDVTDPESAPALLWEFTDANLGFTTSYPAVIYVNSSTWAITFGSGPTDYEGDYDGISTQSAKTYVVNLATGAQLTGSPLSTASTTGTFMGDPISVDLDIRASQCSSGSCSYSSDIAYIGNSEGKLYRITGTTSSAAGTASLVVNTSITTPITSAPAISMDNDGRFWIYFGTGRFFCESDKVNTDNQALCGVKEPIDFDDADTDGDTNELTYGEATESLNVTNYTVYEGGYVDKDGDGTYDVMLDDVVDDIKQYPSPTETAPRDYDGWIMALTGGERCVTKPTVLGGIVTFSTYKPIADVCSYEGDSYLYALYYKTGTAYSKKIIGYGSHTITVGSDVYDEISKKKALGHGVSAAPSLHVGKKKGARVILQTSTGEILEIDEENLPEAYKSRPLHWIQPGN